MPKDLLIATFSEAADVVDAVRALRREKLRIYDVYAPYPIHELSEAMELRSCRLPLVTLAAGFCGLVCGLALQFYTAVLDWPMNVGGKPPTSTLAFIPVSFELTVLFGALATVAAFLLRSRLFPGQHAPLAAPGVTDRRFAVVLRKRDAAFDTRLARAVLEECQAKDIQDVTSEL
jgi:hypothetical protein